MLSGLTNLFTLLKPRYRLLNPIGQSPRGLSTLGSQFFPNSLELIERPSNAPPSFIHNLRRAFAVQAEGGVALSFDKPVSALAAVDAPGLDRTRLVKVILVAGLLVGFFEQGVNGFRGAEGPID